MERNTDLQTSSSQVAADLVSQRPGAPLFVGCAIFVKYAGHGRNVGAHDNLLHHPELAPRIRLANEAKEIGSATQNERAAIELSEQPEDVESDEQS